ncbi:hypothetical protein C8T65DRAFT_121303 [Cerioporus squamosus]|nr:hypothetical protein C8T65DRAFT_121303 [Cerioporus squamosus]
MSDSDAGIQFLEHSVWATIRHCAYCGKDPARGQKLKRCAGCFAGPAYCATECQRADWPEHRLAFHDSHSNTGCRSDSSGSPIDPGTLHFASRSVADFLEAHKWAISAAALATRVIGHGTSLDECPTDEVVLCRIRYRLGAGTSRSYAWESMRLARIDEWLDAIAAFELNKADEIKRKFADAKARADALYGGTPGYLGTLPIVFDIGNTPVVVWHINPQFKPTHPNPLPPSELSGCRPALEDMRRLCMKCVNSGVVLRCPWGNEACGGIALPGRFVRSEGKRTWKQYIDSWVDYKEALRPYSGVAQAFKGPFASGMEPGLIMGVTDQFR